MSKELKAVEYNSDYAKIWDKFVLNESENGTFLQTRNFLSYHPEGKFCDCSLLFFNGTTVVAVLPAHSESDGENMSFLSHKGSTFGGIIIGKKFCNISYVEMIFACLDEYLKDNGFRNVMLKQTSRVFQTINSNLIDYFFFLNKYECSMELGYFIDFNDYDDTVIDNYSASRRRDYRYSLKQNFIFKQLTSVGDITAFYDVLCDNYKKFDKTPVHTLEELLDFKFSRFPNNIEFYGSYLDKEMIAGGMIFLFEGRVAHTQYLAVKQSHTGMFANEFLYTSIINTFQERQFKYLSFGTATLDGGKILNKSLALYKESFGMKDYVNYSYHKII